MTWYTIEYWYPHQIWHTEHSMWYTVRQTGQKHKIDNLPDAKNIFEKKQNIFEINLTPLENMQI
jgi:hypothetical protein